MSIQTSTLNETLVRSRDRLVAAGLGATTAEVDVEVLTRHVLGWDRATLLVRRRDPVPDGLESALAPLLARRARREPVAYITGHREFWGLDFEVSRDVLIPRPETEIVVEEALAVLDDRSGTATRTVLDVGTGSGCIAIALGKAAARVSVVATDVSMGALRIAARNREKHDAATVRFVAGDLLAPLRRSDPWVDVMVSNPPYVPRGATNVMADVRRHEPASALFGGPDGLAVVRRLIVEGAAIVRPGGWLIFEFGDGQESDVRHLLDASPAWSLVRVLHDLLGIARVIVARRAT